MVHYEDRVPKTAEGQRKHTRARDIGLGAAARHGTASGLDLSPYHTHKWFP